MENKEKSKMITGQSSGSGSQRWGGTGCFNQKNEEYHWWRKGKDKCEILVASQKVYKIRSSWLNCALRDNEAVYWVIIGHYKAVAVGN